MRHFLLPFLSLFVAVAPALAQPADALPNGTPAHAPGFTLWLAAPTDRYPHGALGSRIEAAALHLEMADGRVQRLVAPDNGVFEDRHPRAVVVDGRSAVLTVLSRQQTGAALVLVGVDEGRAAILAQAPAIGTANRWLNPVGAADLDGDGRTELLAVRTPHIGGVLQVWQIQGSELVLRWSWPGVSNHVFGDARQGRAALHDVDGDGLPDVVLPLQDGHAIVAIGFAGGRPRELARWPVGAAVAGDFTTLGGRVAVPLADGRTVLLPP